MHYLQEAALLFVQYTPNKPHLTIIAQKVVQYSTKTAQKVVQFITYNSSQEILQPRNLVIKIKRTRRIHRILTDPPHYLVTHKRCVVTPQGFKPWTFRTGIWRSIQLSYGAGIVQTESRTPNLFECFAEVQPIFCKDSANREQKVKLAWTFCRGAAYLVQR